MRRLPRKNERVLHQVRRMRGGGLHGFGLFSALGHKLLRTVLDKGKDLAVNKAKELAAALAEKAIGSVQSRFTGSGAPTASELKAANSVNEQLPQEFTNPLASVVGGKGLAVSKRKPAAKALAAAASEGKAVKKQSAAQLKKERAALKRLEKAQSELEGMGLYMLGDNGRGPRRAPAQC